VQIHPLESAGRAAETMRAAIPSDRELAQALFVALRSRLPGRPATAAMTDDNEDPITRGVRLHADVADARVLIRDPAVVLGPPVVAPPTLADAVRPLVLEDDGSLVPVTYGFARDYALGNVTEHALAELADRWFSAGGHPRLRAITRRALDRLATHPPAFPFINWPEYLARVAAGEASDRSGVVAGQHLTGVT
jgi:hypothetical protein